MPETQKPKKIRKEKMITVMTRGAYDIQLLRMQTGGRLVSNFKAKLGQKSSGKEEDLDKEAKKVLDKLREHYIKLTDGIVKFPKDDKHFKGDEVISDYTELCIMAQYIDLEKEEKKHFDRLEGALQQFPIYTEYLSNIDGIGRAMAGVLISEIDIHECKYPSSLWRWCGLDVAEDGKARSKRAEHLIDKEYIDKNGDKKVKKSITFSPFIHDKILGVLAGSLIRKGNEKYGKIYRDYKHRLEHRPDWKATTKGHRANAAQRYMVKIFMLDYYVAYRTLEGLEVFPPYHEAKLGIVHGQYKHQEE